MANDVNDYWGADNEAFHIMPAINCPFGDEELIVIITTPAEALLKKLPCTRKIELYRHGADEPFLVGRLG
jgi:hypothetical protein